MPGPKRQAIEARFAVYLVKGGDDECWGWTGPITNSGHPTIGKGGKGAGQTSARIVAYRIKTGTGPEREVLTTCDCKLCLNPRHLVLAGEKSRATLRKRFEENVQKAGEDDCWHWKQKPGAAGYGRLSMGKGNSPALAHRVAWELSCGPVPEGVRVRQKCGDRLCCNPAHLFLSLNSLDDPEVSARAVEAWLALRA